MSEGGELSGPFLLERAIGPLLGGLLLSAFEKSLGLFRSSLSWERLLSYDFLWPEYDRS